VYVRDGEEDRQLQTKSLKRPAAPQRFTHYCIAIAFYSPKLALLF